MYEIFLVWQMWSRWWNHCRCKRSPVPAVVVGAAVTTTIIEDDVPEVILPTIDDDRRVDAPLREIFIGVVRIYFLFLYNKKKLSPKSFLVAISRSRSRSPVRFNRGDRRPNKQYNSYHNNRSRSRSRSPLALSPIRATNPLGRPFGGGRGRGTGTVGRWVRGAGPRGRFNNRDRSASRSPKRYNATRKRDYHDDRTTRNRRSRSKDDRKNDKPKSSRASETKTTAPMKNDNDDPPPPGTEDDVADVEQMLVQANKMRKEDIIKRNPDLLKNP